PRATREIQDFVAVLSKSYVRRSRERFANGDEQAMNVMYHVLVELTKLTAPFTPFVAEEIYQELVSSQLENQPESVHLTDYPEADMEYLENNSKLMRQFEQLDEIIELGQTLRTQYGIKIRQPLAEIQVKVIVENSRDKELEKWMQDLISQELNIKQVKEISRLPEVWEKSEEEVQKNTWQTSDGWLIARSLNPRLDIDLALDSNLSKELEEEGWIRELTRTIQALRKSEKMDLEDKVIINASFSSKEKMELVERNKQEIMTTVGASTIRLTEVSESKLSGKPWLLEIESK
ncbi:MAG: class I tRNA ligase family protein, partial [Candidatus Dojkabacteria bacterium]